MYDDAVEISTDDGSVLRATVDDVDNEMRRGTCILLPAFGATAHSMFPFAYALVRNGFRVIRPDFRNHVGLSDGRITDASMATQAEDTALIAARFADSILVAVSLSARAALRALGDRAHAKSALFITPVVDVGHTLAAALDADYMAMSDDELPEKVDVFGHDVLGHFITKCRNAGFRDVKDGSADLRRLSLPYRMIVGDADPWVDVDSVEAVVAAHGSQQGGIVRVAAAAHKLNRNPAVARSYIEALLRSLFELENIPARPYVPTFDEAMRAMDACRENRRCLVSGAMKGQV